eukprot:Tbor_TRINITY_DN5029_c0_g1::TRINITY_DN5029_c0_g1_i1::g.14256::m.14256
MGAASSSQSSASKKKDKITTDTSLTDNADTDSVGHPDSHNISIHLPIYDSSCVSNCLTDSIDGMGEYMCSNRTGEELSITHSPNHNNGMMSGDDRTKDVTPSRGEKVRRLFRKSESMYLPIINKDKDNLQNRTNIRRISQLRGETHNTASPNKRSFHRSNISRKNTLRTETPPSQPSKSPMRTSTHSLPSTHAHKDIGRLSYSSVSKTNREIRRAQSMDCNRSCKFKGEEQKGEGKNKRNLLSRVIPRTEKSYTTVHGNILGSCSSPPLGPIRGTTVEFNSSFRLSEIRNKPQPLGLVLPPYKGGTSPKWVKGVLLGKGTGGAVYEAIDTATNTVFCVKEIKFNQDFFETSEGRRKFEALKEEVALMKSISHPNVVRFIGLERRGFTVYIQMELVPGGTLANVIKKTGKLSELRVGKFTKQLLCALQHIRYHNIVHGDIKGANTLISVDGRLKLGDFGSSRRLNSPSELITGIAGTPYFMAPEVIREEGHNCQADVWSLGCVILEMATKAAPYQHLPEMQAMYKIGFSHVQDRNNNNNRGNTISRHTEAVVNIVKGGEDVGQRGNYNNIQHPPSSSPILHDTSSETNNNTSRDDQRDIRYTNKILNDLPIKLTNVSDMMIDFVRKCLTRDPKMRPTVEQLMCHAWMEWVSANTLSSKRGHTVSSNDNNITNDGETNNKQTHITSSEQCQVVSSDRRMTQNSVCSHTDITPLNQRLHLSEAATTDSPTRRLARVDGWTQSEGVLQECVFSLACPRESVLSSSDNSPKRRTVLKR